MSDASSKTSGDELCGFDRVIAEYRKGIDITLIRENLRRTPEERIERIQAMHVLRDQLRAAMREAEEKRDSI